MFKLNTYRFLFHNAKVRLDITYVFGGGNMAKKVNVKNGKIMDRSKQVGMIKKNCIYNRNSANSSYLIAMTKNNVIYSKNSANSSYCIGMVKNGIIYNRNSANSSYKVGTFKDAEKVISGSSSDAELGAIYILMKSGEI